MVWRGVRSFYAFRCEKMRVKGEFQVLDIDSEIARPLSSLEKWGTANDVENLNAYGLK